MHLFPTYYTILGGSICKKDHPVVHIPLRAAAYVVRVNRGMRSVPTIVFPDGSILVEPGARELAAKFSLDPPPTLSQRIRSLLQGLGEKMQ